MSHRLNPLYQRWPKRKLTLIDGEYILWHIIEHLQEPGSEYFLSPVIPDPVQTCRKLIEAIQDETL